MSKKPVVLMVLDGYGLSDRTESNAIAMANTPVMDKFNLIRRYYNIWQRNVSRILLQVFTTSILQN